MYKLTITYNHRDKNSKVRTQEAYFHTKDEAVLHLETAIQNDQEMIHHIAHYIPAISDKDPLEDNTVMYKTLCLRCMTLTTITYCITETGFTEKEHEIYDRMQKQYVMNDVFNRANDKNIPKNGLVMNEQIALKAACLLVDNSDYDCNLSYWENIDNLIKKCQP